MGALPPPLFNGYSTFEEQYIQKLRFIGALGASRAEAEDQELFAFDDRALRNLDTGKPLLVKTDHPAALAAEKMGMISGTFVHRRLLQAKPSGPISSTNFMNDLSV